MAAVGYTPDEIIDSLKKEFDFAKLMPDGGKQIRLLAALADKKLASWLSVITGVGATSRAWAALHSKLGLYPATVLEEFLHEKLTKKIRGANNIGNEPVSFQEFASAPGTKPLKILATDTTTGRPEIFGTHPPTSGVSVVEAVRASMAYPLVFEPVQIHRRVLSDGGLSSNLPVTLFRDRQIVDGLPTIAFDLVQQPAAVSATAPIKLPTLSRFIRNCADSAIDAGDVLLASGLDHLYRVGIPIPAQFTTLKFDLTDAEKDQLVQIGQLNSHSAFFNILSADGTSQDEIGQLRRRFGALEVFEPILRHICDGVHGSTKAIQCRSAILLRSTRNRRVVAYHANMANDSDFDLDISPHAGCAGRAAAQATTTFADLELAAKNPSAWGFTETEQARVRKDRKAMVSVPIMRYASLVAKTTPHPADVIGVLSVDSSTRLADADWVVPGTAGAAGVLPIPALEEVFLKWTPTLSWILSR